eukprot:2057072-Alexandrium_andersonii.AAC.1
MAASLQVRVLELAPQTAADSIARPPSCPLAEHRQARDDAEGSNDRAMRGNRWRTGRSDLRGQRG